MLPIRIPLPRILSAGEIVVGSGSFGALRALGAARVAVISESPVSQMTEFKKMLAKSLGTIVHVLIEKSPGEPTLELIKPLIHALMEFRPDWIVAVGGGSVIDSAKLAWAFYEHPSAEIDRITRAFGLPALRGQARFVAVPTTAGTGSEVSSASVFLDTVSGRKKAVITHDFLPDIAILDPLLACTAPAGVTAMSGLDALSHALEGYVSRFPNAFLDLQAETAVRNIFISLPRTYRSPTDLSARLDMMNSALMAGWVQNLKIPGIGHAIAHQLGPFGIPHGLASGMLLPAVIRYNSEESSVREKYDHLAAKLGCKDFEGLAQACEELARRLEIAGPLSVRANISADALWQRQSEIVIGAKEDICAKANPRVVSEQAVISLLKSVW